jgi:hypothetical protein
MEKFIKRVLDLDNEGKYQQAVFALYKKFDELFSSGDFGDADDLIDAFVGKEVSSHLIVGILSATYVARDELPSRASYYIWAEVDLGRLERPLSLIEELK